ncbi:MAG: aminoglycoside phosphotransferase family protein [Acidimicrobiia bacterium]
MHAPDHRLQWSDLPTFVRVEIEGALGTKVVDAVGQSGGYGPSLAARCRLADGRRVFVKAVSPAQNPDSPVMMRRESEIAACLPSDAPAPALLHTIDDDEWIALVFEDIDGTVPATPWDPHELQRVIGATRRLGDLVPCRPIRTVAEQYGAMFNGWRILARDDRDNIGDLWCRERVEELAAAEARWEQATVGDGLIHGDVRSDNVLLTADGRVVFVDWTSTCIGAGWFEVLAMLPSVELEGGGEPESVLDRAGLNHLDPSTQTPLVAALAGYFTERGRLPDPPGLPTLRPFQRAQAEVSVAWLRRIWDRR